MKKSFQAREEQAPAPWGRNEPLQSGEGRRGWSRDGGESTGSRLGEVAGDRPPSSPACQLTSHCSLCLNDRPATLSEILVREIIKDLVPWVPIELLTGHNPCIPSRVDVRGPSVSGLKLPDSKLTIKFPSVFHPKQDILWHFFSVF